MRTGHTNTDQPGKDSADNESSCGSTTERGKAKGQRRVVEGMQDVQP